MIAIEDLKVNEKAVVRSPETTYIDVTDNAVTLTAIRELEIILGDIFEHRYYDEDKPEVKHLLNITKTELEYDGEALSDITVNITVDLCEFVPGAPKSLGMCKVSIPYGYLCHYNLAFCAGYLFFQIEAKIRRF